MQLNAHVLPSHFYSFLATGFIHLAGISLVFIFRVPHASRDAALFCAAITSTFSLSRLILTRYLSGICIREGEIIITWIVTRWILRSFI